MYIPPHFRESDLGVLHDLMHAHPIGTLIIHGTDGLTADHIPFLIERDAGELGTLRGHVARANPVWKEALGPGCAALIVFEGPSTYISPNAYPSKRESHRVVPTYNYLTVHAHGVIDVRDDAEWVRSLVSCLTWRFEKDRAQPWRATDAPADFLAERLQEIVGIEITIQRLEGKSKMSQNRSEADREGVVKSLLEQGSPEAVAVAAHVARTLDQP